MGWEFHPAKTAFAEFAEDWDRLNARLYARHPIFDSRFVGPLLDHFGEGCELLCIHRADGAISGALILCPNRLGRWSSFCPAQLQLNPVLLEDASLLETLLAALPGWAWTLELYATDLRFSPDFSRLALPQVATWNAQTMSIELGNEPNPFNRYQGQRGKKLSANIRRFVRRAEAHAHRLTKHTDKAEIGEAVRRYGHLESAGWKGQAGSALSDDNVQGAFYSEILGRFASTGQATAYELYIDDRLAASRLILSSDHMVVFLKTTYDQTLGSLAPGRLLLYLFLREHLTLPDAKPIHFCTNASRDQLAWATHHFLIRHLQIFKTPLYADAFAVMRAFRQRGRSLKSGRDSLRFESLPASVTACKSVDTLSASQYDLGDFAGLHCMERSIDWFELIQRTVYPSDPGVRYYLVAEKETPLVILPVRMSVRGLVKSVTSLSNYYSSLYAPLVGKYGDPVLLVAALATVIRENKGAHMMRFAPMDPNASTYTALLSGLRANNWIPFRFFCFGNWFLTVRGTWQDYLKSRSANLRSSIRRRCKKFAAAGGTLEVVTTPENIEQSIAEFQQIYAASWKNREPYPDFVPSLIRKLAAMGTLRLGIARLQNRAIAAQLWFVDRTKASIYKVAYDEGFASYAPGTVLTAHLMQHVIECDHVQEVDFLIGDDSYKYMWMSDRRERWGIVAYNPQTIIGFVLLIGEVLGRAVKSVVRKVTLALSRARSICQRAATSTKTTKNTAISRAPE